MKKYFSMPYEEVLNEFNVTSDGLNEVLKKLLVCMNVSSMNCLVNYT